MVKQKICLHLGNGTVYLASSETEKWINIDLEGPLASERPDIVEYNKTTIDKYYKFPFRANMENKVTDLHANVLNLKEFFRDESIDKILSVNLIDHLKKNEFIDALKEWKRILKKDGEMIIDIDDRRKQAEIFLKAQTKEEIEWGLRLLYCHHRTPYDTHYWGYTPEYLKMLLEENGWKFEWLRTDYIIHDMYPNFQICVKKV